MEWAKVGFPGRVGRRNTGRWPRAAKEECSGDDREAAAKQVFDQYPALPDQLTKIRMNNTFGSGRTYFTILLTVPDFFHPKLPIFAPDFKNLILLIHAKRKNCPGDRPGYRCQLHRPRR
jgi:hypothetical protein